MATIVAEKEIKKQLHILLTSDQYLKSRYCVCVCVCKGVLIENPTLGLITRQVVLAQLSLWKLGGSKRDCSL